MGLSKEEKKAIKEQKKEEKRLKKEEKKARKEEKKRLKEEKKLAKAEKKAEKKRLKEEKKKAKEDEEILVPAELDEPLAIEGGTFLTPEEHPFVQATEKALTDKQIKEQGKQIDVLQRQIEKQFGKGVIFKGDDKELDINCIPTSIKSLDELLSRNIEGLTKQVGIPLGRTIELYGEEGGGKSTIALRFLGQAQRLGYKCAYLDSENAYDPSWAAKHGVNTNELLYSRMEKAAKKEGETEPLNADEVFDLMRTIVKNRGVNVIVLDSVAALVPRKELENEMGDQQMALVARGMSKAMRVLTALNKKTILIFINQLRSKIGIMWGNPDTTTGGRALKYYASLRLKVRRGEWFPNKKKSIGHEVIVILEKDKIFAKLEEDARFVLFKDGHIDYWENLKDAKIEEDEDEKD